MLISIEKTLLDNSVHTSWATIRDILPTDDGACLRIRKAATPDPDVQELYRHLNIAPDIIKAQHSWAPQDSD